MIYQPHLRFEVDPMPAPRERVRFLMQATALVVEGFVDAQPERFDARLANCLLMNHAELLIAGTACRRPLLLREAMNASAASGLDVLIVRGDDNLPTASFDLKKADVDDLLCAYRMWMPRPSEAAWLIPTAGESRYVRITPLGLEVHDRAPFADIAERRIGLIRGAEFLSVAVQGWF